MQAIDRFGLAIRSEGLWIQAMPGETRTCGGCHESRATGATARRARRWRRQLPLDKKDYSTLAIADRTELPWAARSSGNVQDVFDAKCVQCHDGGAQRSVRGSHVHGDGPAARTTRRRSRMMYQIPYLSLSDAPVETYYEKETVSYPASYVSLLYPSAMMGDSMVEGDVPPLWVVPGSARASSLIAEGQRDAERRRAGKEWAWKTPAHPEDVGVTLTPEERLTLIRMADLGGQYYSRRNVDRNAASYQNGGQKMSMRTSRRNAAFVI